MKADDLPDKVRRRAYEIWEAAGRPNGRDIGHWLQAEAECRTEAVARKALDRSSETPENQPKRTATSRPKEKPKRPKT